MRHVSLRHSVPHLLAVLMCCGTIRVSVGQAANRNCQPGYSGVGGGPCVMCPAGTFKDDSSGNCRACPLNMSSVQGAVDVTRCTCLGGYTSDWIWNNETGRGSCVKCPADAETCTPVDFDCKDGYTKIQNAKFTVNALYRRSWDISFFTGPDCLCEQAGYMETTNQYNNETSCSPCAAGSEKTSAGLQPCEACQAGKYKSTAGTAACIDCPAGYGSVQGSTVCVMCPAGTFREDGPGNCRPCSPNASSL